MEDLMPKQDDPKSGSDVVMGIDPDRGLFQEFIRLEPHHPGCGKIGALIDPTPPEGSGITHSETILAVDANVPQMLAVAMHLCERAKIEIGSIIHKGESQNVVLDAVLIARIDRAVDALSFVGAPGGQTTLARGTPRYE
jgi:hypothetical protein